MKWLSLHRTSPLGLILLVSLTPGLWLLGPSSVEQAPLGLDLDCLAASQHLLPLPHTLPLQDYETLLYRFLFERQYDTDLHWCVDKSVRDTGPWIEGKYYGTHPAVRIYYSPSFMQWLVDGREGPVPDGAMIVKEMFAPPATLYADLQHAPSYQKDPAAFDALLPTLITGWAVMVKDSRGSKDGWFWAGPGTPAPEQHLGEAIEAQLDDDTHIRYAGFGLPCLRCHASAEKEFTFSTLANIKGFEELPLTFRTDESWRTAEHFDEAPLSALIEGPDSTYVRQHFALPEGQRPWTGTQGQSLTPFLQQHLPLRALKAPPGRAPHRKPNPDFTAAFPPRPHHDRDSIRAFPPHWSDHVVPGPDGPDPYLTADNCLGCHGGLGGAPDGITMFVSTGPNYGDGYNLSEYGEWRWSPMGLAGRDPIFHAQLESELALLDRDAQTPGLLKGPLEDTRQAVTNTCLSCHGAMGQRQLLLDAKADTTLDPNFKLDYFYLTEPLSTHTPVSPDQRYYRYGALARDGISCAVCHHINPPDSADVAGWTPEDSLLTDQAPRALAYALFHNSTGRFVTGPADELNGPFEDVTTFPMDATLGITPTAQPFIRDSQLCGTCHTINLPNIGMTKDEFPVLTAAGSNPALGDYPHTIEQATFLEWQNSVFAAFEGDQPGPEFKSCQDCHMPGGFTSPDGTIDIPQLVTQIATIQDTSYPAVEHAAPEADRTVPHRADYTRHEHVGLNVFLLEMFDQFPDILGVDRHDYMTSDTMGNALAIAGMVRQAREETVDLAVTLAPIKDDTLRADVTVTNKVGHRFPSGVAFRRAFLEFLVFDGKDLLWASGRTNGAGLLVDGDGRPLKTELLPDSVTYQPHYETITREDQVQIYEELQMDADSAFTTSFIHRVYHVKDNRLLPRGWRSAPHFEAQGKLMEQFMAATDPRGVGNDSDYKDQGNDETFPGQDRLQYAIPIPEGTGPDSLSVRVTMYYQAIPPYWLHQRFTTAPDGPATRRLYYLTSHLDLDGTSIEDWKLPLVSQTARITDH